MPAASSEPLGPNAATAEPSPTGQRQAPQGTRAVSRRGIAIIGVAVAAGVVVLGLVLGGVIPLIHSSGSGTTPGPEAESVAVASGASIIGGIPGGPWNLTWAGAMVNTFDSGQSAASLFGTPSCPLRNSSVQTIDYPAYNGRYYQGDAPAWVLLYNSSASHGGELIVYAANGTAGEVGVLSGSASTCGFEPYNPSLPKGVIDSPRAATVATETTAGRAFVSEFTHANATYTLSFEKNDYGVIVNDIPVWNILFNICSHGTMTSFQSEVYALNGTVDSSGTAFETC